MKHSPTQDLIAIGGEDGIVRLYDVIDTTDDNCLQYNKSFERQDSRILSICWHPRGKVSLCYVYKSVVLRRYLLDLSLVVMYIGHQHSQNLELRNWKNDTSADFTKRKSK